MPDVTSLMFLVRAAFTVVEAAKARSEDRASRLALQIALPPMPRQNLLDFARLKLTEINSTGADDPRRQILVEFGDHIRVLEEGGRRTLSVHPHAPEAQVISLLDALRQAFPGQGGGPGTMSSAQFTLASWASADANRQDRAKFVLFLSGMALDLVANSAAQMGLRGPAQNIVAAITSSLSSHLAAHHDEIVATAFTGGAGARIAEALLSTSLNIAESQPELFSDEAPVQALVRATVGPLRQLNATNAGLNLTTTQRLIRVRETLRGEVGIGLLKTLHEYRAEIFDGDYPERDSAAGIVTEALFEGVVSELSKDGQVSGIFKPSFFTRVYPGVLDAVAASPEAFVRGSGQHVEMGKEFLIGITSRLKALDGHPQLAQSIFTLGMDLTRRHARAFLVDEARSELAAWAGAREAGSSEPWALVSLTIATSIAGSMIEAFESEGPGGIRFPWASNQQMMLELVGMVADQAARTPGMIVGDDVNPEVLKIAQGVAAFIASEHASLVTRADWQRVSATAVALAMENPDTLFSLDADTPQDFLAVTLIQAVLQSAHGNLVMQADGSQVLQRQRGRVLFGRTLAEALVTTLQLAATHAHQLASEGSRQALGTFIERLNFLASEDADGLLVRLSSGDWLYAYKWFVGAVVASGEYTISDQAILDLVNQARVSFLSSASAQPFGTAGGGDIYYQPVPANGADG